MPKITSIRIMDMLDCIALSCEIEFIGIRSSEKLYEVLISRDELRHTCELDNTYIVQPVHLWWRQTNLGDGRSVPEGFQYTSDENDRCLSIEELRGVVNGL